MNRIKKEKSTRLIRCIAILCAMLTVLGLGGCGDGTSTDNSTLSASETAAVSYSYTTAEYYVERGGVKLHLDCTAPEGQQPDKQILLTHGVTYSSHEFDIDYEDYSLVRFLAREGYAVWKLDIAGFGQSGEVADGFLPDSDYAAEDINAAVEKIVSVSGRDKIDLLGWSWGTVTAGRYAAKHPEHINRLVLSVFGFRFGFSPSVIT